MKVFVMVILVAALLAVCQGGTFRPFVRSRYSLRWRTTTELTATKEPMLKLTTEQLPTTSLDTTQANQLNMQLSTHLPHEHSPSTRSPRLVLEQRYDSSSTHHPKEKSSTVVNDYDYYGNGEAD